MTTTTTTTTKSRLPLPLPLPLLRLLLLVGIIVSTVLPVSTVLALDIGAHVTYTGDASPAQITADQNDYAPANLGTRYIFYLSTDANRTLTGLAGGPDGKTVVLYNTGSFFLILAHENAGSTAANRFLFPSATNVVISPGESITLQYQASSVSRWRPAARATILAQTTACSSTDKVRAYDAVTGLFTCAADVSGAGGGDAIEVEDGNDGNTFTAIDTTARLDDSGDIDFQRTAGPPDIVIGVVRPNSVTLTTDTDGVLSVAEGGNGAAPTGDDQVNISDSAAAATWRTLSDSDGATEKLQYDQATNTFSTGTDDDVPDASDFGALSATSPITQTAGTISTSIATNRLVGRTTASAGVMEQITPDATLSLTALGLGVVDVVCTGCLGTTEIANLDTGDVTTGTFATARLPAATPTTTGAVELATTTEVLTGTEAGAFVSTPDGLAALWEKGANESSATTVSFGEGGLFHITGTTTITDIDFDVATNGRCVTAIFDSALTLTHNATTLLLPGGVDILTAANDRATICQDAADNVYVINYVRAAGTPVFDTDSFCVAISDETTNITTGVAKVTFRMPYAFTVTAVRASINTTSSSGIPTFDINEGGTTIITTKLTIDVSELTSVTAAVPPVISDASLADDASMTVDIDVAGTGAKGAKICIIGRHT